MVRSYFIRTVTFVCACMCLLRSIHPADVLKARLKTMGVVEHTFLISSGHNRGVAWKIYDVGGARNQRHAWAPYFEDGELFSFVPLSPRLG